MTESGIIRNIDNYQATFTDARVTVDKPNVLTVMNHNKFVSEYGTLNVVGEIENSGSATSHFTKVIATFYDVKGEIIDTSFTFTEPNDIMSNMIANFKIRQSDLVDEISSYSLTVESREFADSSIIKVAPQPEPRKRVPTEKISLSNMQVVDQLGTRINNISVGQQVVLQSNMENNLGTDQKFAYILQIKDSENITVMIAWMNGKIPKGETFDIGLSWIPDAAGKYTADVFVWESVANPDPLALRPIKSSIVVQE